MSLRKALIWLLPVGFMIAGASMLPAAGYAQDGRVKAAMETLKSKAAALGTPAIKGAEPVVDKAAPAIYFGAAKQNNEFSLVDGVAGETGGTATIFVKSGDEFVRVATNVRKADGTRAIGTSLDPKGEAIKAVAKNEAFYGDVDILGKPYAAGYEPIRDAANNVIGVYYVGYPK